MNLCEISNGLGPKMAAGLLRMSVDMIPKMNGTSTTNTNDNASQHYMENMTSMAHDLSTSNEKTQGSKG